MFIVQRLLSKNFKEDWRVHLNVEDMKELDLCAEDFVKLSWKEGFAVCAVWPTLLCDIGFMMLSDLMILNWNIEVGEEIKIELIKTLPTLKRIVVSKNRFDPIFLKGKLKEIGILKKGMQFDINGATLSIEYIEPDTEFGLFDDDSYVSPKISKSLVSFDKIGGLSSQIQIVKETIELVLQSSSKLEEYNLKPPKGILLYGPPGTGKTLIAKAVASEMNAYLISISGSDVSSKYFGDSEAKLSAVFKEAEANAPAIIFIDEIDSICPKRDNASQIEKRIVATLLYLMDGMYASNRVVVIGATNRPNDIDAALRRPGRFDKEIEISIPTSVDRTEIIEKLVSDVPNVLSLEDLEQVGSLTHGYVGADLSLLVREASMTALKLETKLDLNLLLNAMALVNPSAMREIAVQIPKVYWSDIGGQEETKRKLREAIELPLKKPEVFLRMGITPPSGILLYGPPGTGKTLLAKALATESQLNFIAVKGPEIFNKYVGESEKTIRDLFRKARNCSPSIIFFDEIDSIGSQRNESNGVNERVLTQLLVEMDGIESLVNVTVVAATNRPDILDSALMRPGRFDRIVYVPLPDYEARLSILSIQSRKMKFDALVNLNEIAKLTSGYSGAEITAICTEATLLAIEHRYETVQPEHFTQCLKTIKPRISKESIEFYESFSQK